MYDTLLWQVNTDGILLLQMNRPDHLNAFTVTMYQELVSAFKRASSDNDINAIVLTGQGKAFCAGMDLSAEGNVFGLDENIQPTVDSIRDNYQQEDYLNGIRDTGGQVTLAMQECRKPIIAAINGVGVGIGATMTLAADIRLMSEQAKLGFVFSKIGIVPEACSTWYLPRLVGLQTALVWCYSGELISAEEALTKGLVYSIHSQETVLDAAITLATQLTHGKSMAGLACTRAMLHNSAALESPKEAHIIESLAVHYLSQRDGREGVNAFLEKRAANFTSTADDDDLPPGFPWR